MNCKEIKPLKSLKKINLKLPSSKSLTQRALICAALAEGVSKIINPLLSEDTLLLKQALEATGINIKEEGDTWIVTGKKQPYLSEKKVYLGNNGTGSRFFLAFSTLGKGSYIEISGKPRLHE